MKLTARQSYPADPATVHAMLTDEAFLDRAAVEMGAVEHSVAVTADTTTVDAALQAPAPVRAFLGPHLRLRTETTWGLAAGDGSRSGALRITVPGSPVLVRATARLAPAASGTTIEYEGDLDVSVPLLGPAIEQQAAPEVLAALAAQERAGRRWLAATDGA